MSADTAEFKPHHLPALCEKIFCKDGYASILPNFEHRPEQEQMAFYCAQTFALGEPLIFEAGTVVGKSLAYLVSGLIAAKRFRKKLIIATNTISLQQQIIEKDLPRIRMMFEQKPGKIRKADILAACPDISISLIERTLKQMLDNGEIRKIGASRTTAYIKT